MFVLGKDQPDSWWTRGSRAPRGPCSPRPTWSNRLAKLSTGHARLAFYRLKTDCLSAAIEIYPDAFWIDAVDLHGISAILSIRSRLGTSLHVAAAGLSLRARACLMNGEPGDPSMGEALPSGDWRW